MFWDITFVIVSFLYVVYNLVIAKSMSAKKMKESFVKGQCFVGKICANIFYAPAWLLKGLRAVVLFVVA